MHVFMHVQTRAWTHEQCTRAGTTYFRTRGPACLSAGRPGLGGIHRRAVLHRRRCWVGGPPQRHQPVPAGSRARPGADVQTPLQRLRRGGVGLAPATRPLAKLRHRQKPNIWNSDPEMRFVPRDPKEHRSSTFPQRGQKGVAGKLPGAQLVFHACRLVTNQETILGSRGVVAFHFRVAGRRAVDDKTLDDAEVPRKLNVVQASVIDGTINIVSC